MVQQYEVPQFMKAKSKILGPLSFVQVVLFLGVMGFLFVTFVFLKFIFWIAMATPLILITVFFSFYQPNGRPMTAFSSSMFKYMGNSQTYVWKKEIDVGGPREEGVEQVMPSIHIKISESEVELKRKQPKDSSQERAFEISEMLNIETPEHGSQY